MRIGQHTIAVTLIVMGVVRGLSEGGSVALIVTSSAALLAWYATGMVLVKRVPSRQAAAWWLIGFACVWLAAITVSAEFAWVAFLLWLLAGHLLRALPAISFSILVYVAATFAPVLHYGSTSYASVFGPLIGGVFALGISRGYLELLRDASEREELVQSLTQAQQEMAELQGELALSQRQSGVVSERTRLSRDIHDTIAQGLSSIRLLTHVAAEHTHDPKAQQTLQQVETIAADSLVDVRKIVGSLAPAQLENSPLAEAIQRLLDRLQEETGIDAELRVDATLAPLPTQVEIALLRTAQSALANVRLHSEATQVIVSLIDDDNAVRLDFIDNGRGFNTAEWGSMRSRDSSSYGLQFMRTRLRELGGDLAIESSHGEGVALSAYLPIQAPHDQIAQDQFTQEG